MYYQLKYYLLYNKQETLLHEFDKHAIQEAIIKRTGIGSEDTIRRPPMSERVHRIDVYVLKDCIPLQNDLSNSS